MKQTENHEKTKNKLKSEAFRLLTIRDRTAHELQTRLEKKYRKEDVAEVVSYLKEIGYINDRQFAQNYVEYRNRFRPTGNFLLRIELRGKGVDDSIIDEVLNSENTEFELALRLAEGRAESMKGLDLSKQMRRLFSLLQRRGFPWQIAQKVVSETLDTDLQKDYN